MENKLENFTPKQERTVAFVAKCIEDFATIKEQQSSLGIVISNKDMSDLLTSFLGITEFDLVKVRKHEDSLDFVFERSI